MREARRVFLLMAVLGSGCNAISGVGDLAFGETTTGGAGGVTAASSTSASVAGSTSEASSSSASSSGHGGASGPGGGSSASAGGAGTATSSGGGGVGGASVVACADQYPAALHCVETATSCEFYVMLQGMSCSQICAQFGGECLDAWDDDGDTCGHLRHYSCQDSSRTDILCTCSHGCGGGPACQGGTTCNGGACS